MLSVKVICGSIIILTACYQLQFALVVRAKDYDFSCKIPGQAGGNWELLEIKKIMN